MFFNTQFTQNKGGPEVTKKKTVISNKLKPWLTESGLLTIQGWARDGLTNEQIAHNLGINPKTLYDWIKKWPEIEEALRLGKEVVDRKVENALYNRAIGYSVTLEKEKMTKDGDVVLVREDVHYPGDVTAQIFWLKNRKSETWRDKQDINHSGHIDGEGKLGAILQQLVEDGDD